MISTGRINSVFIRDDFPKLRKNDEMVGQSATIANDNFDVISRIKSEAKVPEIHFNITYLSANLVSALTCL